MLNRKEAMQVLLEAGADILQRNRQGWFPDHEARCGPPVTELPPCAAC